MVTDSNPEIASPAAGRSFAAGAAEWFEIAEVEPGVHVVAEPGHVFSWLIAGSERSLLLDTGLGVADIRAAVEPFASSPVSVVNSHTHFDHIGGNELFDDVAMHELGPEWLESNSTREELASYADLAAGMEEAWRAFAAADREGWFVLGPGQTVRAWPAEANPDGSWAINPPMPQRTLAEGDTVDLGDRSLRVIHTPGHAPDHICLLDEAAGVLFAQDQAYYGPHLIYLDGSDVEAFALATRRLADELRGSVRSVYVAHCLRPSVPPSFLEELAVGAESVAAGEAKLQPAPGLFGEPVLGADFGHFSILVPPEASG